MNPPLTCLIVDDEPLARQLLEDFTARVPSLRWIGSCGNAVEALEAIDEHHPDVVFLDVQMPELTGLDLLGICPRQRPQIVLTTAYPQFAVQGFEYDVTDYLLKPFSFDRYLRAVHKIRHRLSGRGWEDSEPKAPEPARHAAVFVPDHVWIKIDKKIMNLAVEEIYYVEGMKDYVKIHLLDRFLVAHLTMTKMEELLPPTAFVRINRSFLVRRSAIRAIVGNELETTHHVRLPVGGRYRDEIRRSL